MDAHYFAIGTDGRQYGPLSEAEIRIYLADGRVSRHSRARRETDAQWVALREMPEFEEVTRPPHLGGGSSSSTEAAAAPAQADQRERSASGAHEVDPTSCFRRGFALVAADFWILGLSAVGVMLLLAGFTQTGLLALPLGVFLNDLLLGGLFVLYIGALRGRRPTLDEVFNRVMAFALRLILAGLVQSLVTAPLFLITRLAVTTRSPVAAGVAAVLAVPTLYLAVAYVFLLPLIADKGLGISAALAASRKAVHPQWLRIFGILLAIMLLGVVSLLMAGIPLLITIPVSVAAFCYAYTDLFDEQGSDSRD